MVNNRNSLTLRIIVTLQILIIVTLLIKIQYKKNDVLGEAVSVNPIKIDSVLFPENSNYRYYYEPRFGRTEEVLQWNKEKTVSYNINYDSLNESLDYRIKKDKNTFRIITLGDSFTFGQNVSTENNWTELLEKDLNANYLCSKITKYEVINLGVYGYDTAYEVERYKIRGLKYNPDLIIWFITDLVRITEENMKIYSKLTDKNKKTSNSDVTYSVWRNVAKMRENKYSKSSLLDYQLTKYRIFRKQYYPSNKPLLLISALEDIYKFKGENTHIGETAVLSNREFLLPDGHFNESGHQKFALEVVESLKEKSLLPCN